MRTVPRVNRPVQFLKNKQTNYFYLGKTKQKYPRKWFVTRLMFTIHQKRFSFLKKTFISFFTNGANRPGVNRPILKMVLERIVLGGTGFGANRPVTRIKVNPSAEDYLSDDCGGNNCIQELDVVHRNDTLISLEQT